MRVSGSPRASASIAESKEAVKSSTDVIAASSAAQASLAPMSTVT
jgi:hypothetical protein